MKRVLSLVPLIALLFLSRDYSPVPLPTTRTGTRFVESKGTLQGDIWLSWEHNTRDGFVRGFLLGYGVGWRGGCNEAVETMNATGQISEKNRYSLCLQPQHEFQSAINRYEEFVTAFYLDYPDDRDLPIRMLLKFADEKSLEQVHQWVNQPPERAPLTHRK